MTDLVYCLNTKCIVCTEKSAQLANGCMAPIYGRRWGVCRDGQHVARGPAWSASCGPIAACQLQLVGLLMLLPCMAGIAALVTCLWDMHTHARCYSCTVTAAKHHHCLPVVHPRVNEPPLCLAEQMQQLPDACNRRAAVAAACCCTGAAVAAPAAAVVAPGMAGQTHELCMHLILICGC